MGGVPHREWCGSSRRRNRGNGKDGGEQFETCKIRRANPQCARSGREAMLSFSGSLRIFVAVEPCDIRKGYLSPGAGKAPAGYIWVASRPGGHTIYHWKTCRSADCIREILPDAFEGILQTDAYAAYGSFAKESRKVQMAGCLSHVRRKFFRRL
jgi:hypothetical protein